MKQKNKTIALKVACRVAGHDWEPLRNWGYWSHMCRLCGTRLPYHHRNRIKEQSETH